MAEQLQRKYSLPVVKVRLVDLARGPAVQIELVLNVEGEQKIVADQTHPLDLFGFISVAGSGEPQLSVPKPVVQWVGGWVADQLVPEDVLWLHLVKPYGQLGAVPWERDLQPACRIPLLRLPDALPSDERMSSTVHVALCATMPVPDGYSTVLQMVPPATRALVAAMGDRLRLHVFPDPDTHDFLKEQLADLADSVTLYRADGDLERTLEPTPGLDNPWLRWMRQTMGGRAFDAVHFITHGYALGTDGALITTSTPTSPDRIFPRTVQVRELRTFLTHVGANVAGFTTPFDNYSDYGLLKVVDELGALRAGPVLLHNACEDRKMAVLGDAYAFLTAELVGQPPASPALVLFAQPRQVDGVKDGSVRREFDLLKRSEAVATYLSRDETPAWIAASEQYIKEREAELIRFEESKTDQKPSRGQLAYYAGVESALHEIKGVVDKHAEGQLWPTSS